MRILLYTICLVLIFVFGFYAGEAKRDTEFKIELVKMGLALVEDGKWRLKEEKDLFVKIKVVTGTLIKNPKKKQQNKLCYP